MENPYERTKTFGGEWARAVRTRVPTLPMVHAAYMAGDLEYEDLERLTEAALKGEATEIPKPMLDSLFAPVQPWTREERRAYMASRLLEAA